MRQLPLQFALIWHSYFLLAICGLLTVVSPTPAFIAALLIILVDKRLWQFQRIVLSSIIFFAAFVYCQTKMESADRIVKNSQELLLHDSNSNDSRICGIVQKIQTLPDRRFRILLDKIELRPTSKHLNGLCQWTWENPPVNLNPLPGQKVCISRHIRPIHSFANFDDTEYESSLFAQNIYWRMWSSGDSGNPEISGQPFYLAKVRQNILDNFLNIMGDYAPYSNNNTKPQNVKLSQAKAILLALLFGDRSYLDQNTVNNFSSATLAHSLALSGQHMGIAGFFGFLIIISIAKIYPAIYLNRPKPMLVVIASIPFALAYLWIGNAPPSLMRAACMLFIFAFWLCRGSIFSGIDLLCAALFLILLYDPLFIFDVGLQLSALCVGIITICWPAIKKIIPTIDIEKQKFSVILKIRLLQIFLISFFIQIALLPISLSRFNIAGFWFPLNLLWLPLLGIFILPMAAVGLILASLPFNICHTAAGYILNIASIPCGYLVNILQYLKEHGLLLEPAFITPNWSVFLAFAVLALALAWLFGNKSQNKILEKSKYLIAIGLILLAIAPIKRLIAYFDNKIYIEALDVGQGQAISLRLPKNISILIDGGGSLSPRFDIGKNIIAPYISYNKAPYISAVINTHPDMDHLGGLFHILDDFKIDYLFDNGNEASDIVKIDWLMRQNQHNTKILNKGDTIILGDIEDNLLLEVLHPPVDKDWKWEGNSASIIIKLSKNGKGIAIFTGDAEKDSLKYLIANNANLDAVVLFAPHHGSDRSLLPKFYAAVQPAIVIVSCGFQNRWKYPGKKLRQFLNDNDVPLLDTGNKGKISLIFKNDGTFNVETTRK